MSVSAEAYGAWNQVRAFAPPEHPKTAEQEGRLKQILSNRQLVVFSSLNERDMNVILLAMEKCCFKPKERIIQQGDDGDCLYVVEEGVLECKVLTNGVEQVVKKCAPGDVFGELALLYNCPRAASVDAVNACTVWRLDRETFNHVAKDASLKRNARYDVFLRKVSLFSSLNDHQRAQIADSLKAEKVRQDDIVVHQGEEGNKFYIVEEGTLVAMKSTNNGPAKQVMRFSAGDYFGELAMLKDQPRAATIKVTSDSATILSMDRDTFKRLLGPLEHLMSSRSKMYSDVQKGPPSPCAAAQSEARKTTIQMQSDDGNHEDEEEDEDDEDVDELPPPPRRALNARMSVSAEAYGAWNQVRAFAPPEHPKTAEQEGRLKQILSNRQLVVFSSLNERDMNVILLAMEKCCFKPKERIIQQGDDGDCLYVVEEGVLECKVLTNGVEQVVKKCAPGDVFGELALLYNCPRAASVDAVNACTVWRLDRETFNHVAKDASLKRNARYDVFLRKVSLFSSLNDHQRAQIADSLKAEKVRQDDIVVHQGEEGNKFYIVEEGTLVAMKSTNNGPAKQVMRFSAGDYFGELAMLKDQPRAATIKVTSDSATILSMDRDTFKRLLGPLEHLMSSRSSTYKWHRCELGFLTKRNAWKCAMRISKCNQTF